MRFVERVFWCCCRCSCCPTAPGFFVRLVWALLVFRFVVAIIITQLWLGADDLDARQLMCQITNNNFCTYVYMYVCINVCV